MNRGKRPSHPTRHLPSAQRAKGDGPGRKPSGGRGGAPSRGRGGAGGFDKSKRPRFEDDQKERQNGPPKKAVSFATPNARPQKVREAPPLITPGPVDAKGKKPSRADVKDPVKLLSDGIVPPPRSFNIIFGSYEKLLYGLDGTFAASSSSSTNPSATIQPTLTPIFIFPAHVSCIKAVAASPEGGKWLATGSTDETIKVWDLRRRKEIGGLMQHEGTRFLTHCIH